MNIQELVKLWPQYQTWLKQNNITPQNIQQKAPDIISAIKSNPSQSKQLEELLSNPELAKIANQFNIKTATPMPNGNLTQEQLDMIKKFKR